MDEEEEDDDDIDGFPNIYDYHDDDGDDDPDDNAPSWSPANLVDHLIAVAHVLAPLEVHLPVIELRLHLCTAYSIGIFAKNNNFNYQIIENTKEYNIVMFSLLLSQGSQIVFFQVRIEIRNSSLDH